MGPRPSPGALLGKLTPASTLALLLALTASASAQIIVELPFDPGIPERVVVSKSWSDPAPLRDRPAPAPPALSAANLKEPQTPVPTTPRDLLAALIPPTIEAVPRSTARPGLQAFSTPPSHLLSTFAGDSASGAVIPTSSWAGNVTQHSGYITIGGTARDDNGWRATGLSLDASGMSYLTITAQRDPGNAAGTLFLQFEDRLLHTPQVFSLSTANFAVGTPTQVQIVLGVWSGDFDFTQIVSWSIGGGGVGTNDFRMSLYSVEFATSAIPEPSTYAALLGATALAAAAVRRRRKTAAPDRRSPARP